MKTLAAMYFEAFVNSTNGTITAVEVERAVGHALNIKDKKARQYKISQWLQAAAKAGKIVKANGERTSKGNAWNIYTRAIKSPLVVQVVKHNAFTVKLK